jgi:hypothetical protein
MSENLCWPCLERGEFRAGESKALGLDVEPRMLP